MPNTDKKKPIKAVIGIESSGSDSDVYFPQEPAPKPVPKRRTYSSAVGLTSNNTPVAPPSHKALLSDSKPHSCATKNKAPRAGPNTYASILLNPFKHNKAPSSVSLPSEPLPSTLSPIIDTAKKASSLSSGGHVEKPTKLARKSLSNKTTPAATTAKSDVAAKPRTASPANPLKDHVHTISSTMPTTTSVSAVPQTDADTIETLKVKNVHGSATGTVDCSNMPHPGIQTPPTLPPVLDRRFPDQTHTSDVFHKSIVTLPSAGMAGKSMAQKVKPARKPPRLGKFSNSKSAMKLKPSLLQQSSVKQNPTPAAKGKPFSSIHASSKAKLLLPIKLATKKHHKPFTLLPKKPISRDPSKLQDTAISIPFVNAETQENDVKQIKDAIKRVALSGKLSSSSIARSKRAANIIRDEPLSRKDVYSRDQDARIKKMKDYDANAEFARQQKEGEEAAKRLQKIHKERVEKQALHDLLLADTLAKQQQMAQKGVSTNRNEMRERAREEAAALDAGPARAEDRSLEHRCNLRDQMTRSARKTKEQYDRKYKRRKAPDSDESSDSSDESESGALAKDIVGGLKDKKPSADPSPPEYNIIAEVQRQKNPFACLSLKDPSGAESETMSTSSTNPGPIRRKDSNPSQLKIDEIFKSGDKMKVDGSGDPPKKNNDISLTNDISGELGTDDICLSSDTESMDETGADELDATKQVDVQSTREDVIVLSSDSETETEEEDSSKSDTAAAVESPSVKSASDKSSPLIESPLDKSTSVKATSVESESINTSASVESDEPRKPRIRRSNNFFDSSSDDDRPPRIPFRGPRPDPSAFGDEFSADEDEDEDADVNAEEDSDEDDDCPDANDPPDNYDVDTDGDSDEDDDVPELMDPYDDDTDDYDSDDDDDWQPPAYISDDDSDSDTGDDDSSDDGDDSSNGSSIEEPNLPTRHMDKNGTDLDYTKVVLVFEESFFQYGPAIAPLTDLQRGRLSADLVFTKEFLMLFGAAAVVRVHPRMYPMISIMNRFSIRELANKAGYTVPAFCDAGEYIICCGAVEIAMSLKCTDIGSGTSAEDYNRDELTVIRFVKALQQMGYIAAKLNPSWASTHFVLKPGCLDKTHLKLCDVLVAIMAARPRVVSLVMFVGGKLPIHMENDVDGLFMGNCQRAYEYFWDWRDWLYNPESEFARQGGGRFYVVRCDMAVNLPRQNYPFRFENIRDGVDRRAIFGVEQRNDAERHGYHVVTTKFSTFNGSMPHGGVNKTFKKPWGLYSPSNLTKVKCYPSSGHLVKTMHVIQDVNMSFRLGKIPVRKMKAYIFLMLPILHSLVDIIRDPDLGIVPRVEFEITSPFPRDDVDYQYSVDRLNLKTQGRDAWEGQFEWCLQHLMAGSFNINCMQEDNCPTVQQLLEWAYYYAGCLLIELKKSNDSPVRDCVPQNTGMYYMNYIFGMFVASCGLSGSSIYKATKKYLQSPPDVCYDPSGILSLIHKKEEVDEIDPQRDDFLRELTRNNTLYDDGYTVLPAGINVLLLVRRDKFTTGMTTQDQVTHENFEEAIFEEGETAEEMYRFLLPKLQQVFRHWSRMITNAFRAGSHDQTRLLKSLKPSLRRQADLLARIPQEGRDLGQDAQERMIIWMPSMFSVDAAEVREIAHVVRTVPDAGVQESMNSMDPPVNDPVHALYDKPPEYVEGIGAEEEDNPDPDPEIFNVDNIRLKYSRAWCHHVVQRILQEGKVFAPVMDAHNRNQRGVKLDEINDDYAAEPTATELMSQECRTLLLQMYDKIGNKTHARQAAGKCKVYIIDIVTSPPFSATDVWIRIVRCYNARYPNMFVLEEYNSMRLDIDPPLANSRPGFGPSGDRTMADMQAMSTYDNIDRQSFFDNETANREKTKQNIRERMQTNMVAVRRQRGMIARLGTIVDGEVQLQNEDMDDADAVEQGSEHSEEEWDL